MSEVLIEAKGVRRSFRAGGREVEVLRGVDLRVEAGESVAITGASGSGKSTFLQILGGLDRPTGGRVEFGGRDWWAMGERERTQARAKGLGFVFQAYHLLPELTVRENVILAGLTGRMAWLNGRVLGARADELLERTGLTERAAHRPNELSGGEQQRTALARALMNRPRLLLADEPTGNLDSKTGEGVLALLFELVKEAGTGLVMVTHNAAVTGRFDRHAVMRDGLLDEGGGAGKE